MTRNLFEGKNVLVVGGNSGIGLAAAKAFSQEGANLIITGRNVETLTSKIALMNKFLDAPSFFYFEDVIGFDPTTSISTGSFTVNRNGKTIHVRSIQVGVIGKNGKYGVYGTPVTSKEFYSLRNGMVLHGEPIYEENDVERANPVGMRYYYTTNDVNHSQNCWIAINWADASTFESIIGW